MEKYWSWWEEDTEREDTYKERVYAVTVNIDKHCTFVVVSQSPEVTRAGSTLARELADFTTQVNYANFRSTPLLMK